MSSRNPILKAFTTETAGVVAEGERYSYWALVEKSHPQYFPRGPVVENPPSNARGMGSIPTQGARISHARGNEAQVPQVENPCTTRKDTTGCNQDSTYCN